MGQAAHDVPKRRALAALLGVAGVVALVVLVIVPISSASKGSLIPKSPVSASTLVAQGIHNGTITPAIGTGASASGPTSLTVLPNVKANSGSQPANEVPITGDPLNGSNLLSGANDYSCSTVQGFYSSTNAGASWSTHCMPAQSGLFGFGDPNVAFDKSGNEYILGIDANGSALNGRIVYQKSSDNGVTWTPDPPATAVPALFAGGLTDKEWTEADHGTASPHPGALYVSVTQFNSSFNQTAISVAHSYDGAATWTDVQVGPTRTVPTVDQFSDLAVGNDGTVYLTYMECFSSGPAGDCGGSPANMYFSKSTDGGVTWTSPSIMVAGVNLAPDSCFCAYYGNIPGTSERLSNIPVIDVASTGTLYVVYYDYVGGFVQLRVINSTNGGTTWSAPQAILPSSSDQAFGWLSVKGKVIGVTYLDNASGTTYNTFALISKDGVTWKGPSTLNTVASNFNNDGFGGGFIGDYIGNIWTTALHASWPDTRTGVSADETGGLGP